MNETTTLKSWKTNKLADFRVLVVDDDPPMVKMVEHLLIDMGITSILAYPVNAHDRYM